MVPKYSPNHLFATPIFLTLFVLTTAVVPAAEKPEVAFTLRLPTVKLGYPGVEYWAEVEHPNGARQWAFAEFAGGDTWTVAFPANVAGNHRLLRIEGRQGEKREAVLLGTNSKLELQVRHPAKRPQFEARTLVEAGSIQTIFAAQEPWCVNDHTLVQGPDKTWHLFGITHPKPLDFFKDPGRRLAHATATSLLQSPWQPQPAAITADWENYKEYLLWAPHVIRHQRTFHMFVCAGEKDSHRYRIHLLTSPDLKNWRRHPGNPLLADGFDGRDPMVMRLNDQWVMYYTATTTSEGGNHIVAAMKSDDLAHWKDRKVVFVHPRAGTFGGPTESPFIVRRGERYYLFLCDNDWTDVYLSDDPFHWELERKAGRIHSHASEVVRDGKGRWYISHAGWMRGPVALAPLQWHDGLDEAPTNISPASE